MQKSEKKDSHCLTCLLGDVRSNEIYSTSKGATILLPLGFLKSVWGIFQTSFAPTTALKVEILCLEVTQQYVGSHCARQLREDIIFRFLTAVKLRTAKRVYSGWINEMRKGYSIITYGSRRVIGSALAYHRAGKVSG